MSQNPIFDDPPLTPLPPPPLLTPPLTPPPPQVLADLFSPKVLLLPPHIQAILVQTSMKLYGSILVDHEKIGADEDSRILGDMYLSKVSARVYTVILYFVIELNLFNLEP